MAEESGVEPPTRELLSEGAGIGGLLQALTGGGGAAQPGDRKKDHGRG